MKTAFKCISKKWFTAALLAMLVASAQGGSLWREGITDERGMFADKRAKSIGDIVTIVVDESASLANSLSSKTSKEASSGVEGLASNIVNQFVAAIPHPLFGKKTQANAANSGIVIPNVPTMSGSGSTSFTGGGSIENKQTITAKAAVQVIDVLPNGNLVIEGLRDISFSKERQFVSLRGIIRTEDIATDNTVASSRVANARVQIISEGSLTDSQKKGWLLRLNDKISPF